MLAGVLSLLKWHPNVAWAARMNTGAVTLDAARFVRFGFKGCSDVIGQMKDGRFLAIEVKRPGGKATANQQEFLRKVAANGGVSGVADSIEAAQRIVS